MWAVLVKAAKDARERLRREWRTLTPDDLRELAVRIEQGRIGEEIMRDYKERDHIRNEHFREENEP